jgi:hypothetical protein
VGYSVTKKNSHLQSIFGAVWAMEEELQENSVPSDGSTFARAKSSTDNELAFGALVNAMTIVSILVAPFSLYKNLNDG